MSQHKAGEDGRGFDRAALCPCCLKPAAAGHAHCPSCGTPLPAASARLGQADGRHMRPITFLCFDLVHSERLSRELDPEDFTALHAAFHRTAWHAITAFGGFVARHEGDCTFAYFGYPDEEETTPNARSARRCERSPTWPRSAIRAFAPTRGSRAARSSSATSWAASATRRTARPACSAPHHPAPPSSTIRRASCSATSPNGCVLPRD